MMWVGVVLFFLIMGVTIFLLIRYVDSFDNDKFAQENRDKVNREMYRKPKDEDITDL